MKHRQSNAGQPIGTAGHFHTEKRAEMEAYDSLDPILRRVIDNCVHEFSALQAKQIMEERGLTPVQMALQFIKHDRRTHEALAATLPPRGSRNAR